MLGALPRSPGSPPSCPRQASRWRALPRTRASGAAGAHAPATVAQDLASGFLLLGDLGATTYLQALGPQNAPPLFADATDALILWQLATRPGELPPYDEALLRREMNLFPEWYVGKHLKKNLTPAQ